MQSSHLPFATFTSPEVAVNLYPSLLVNSVQQTVRLNARLCCRPWHVCMCVWLHFGPLCSAGRAGKCIIDRVWATQSKEFLWSLIDAVSPAISPSDSVVWMQPREARVANFSLITSPFYLFFFLFFFHLWDTAQGRIVGICLVLSLGKRKRECEKRKKPLWVLQ